MFGKFSQMSSYCLFHHEALKYTNGQYKLSVRHAKWVEYFFLCELAPLIGYIHAAESAWI